MTLRAVLLKVTQQEDVNFLLTNRLPRRWLTLFIGWLSHLEQPIVRDLCLLAWRLFCDLDLSEARTTRFKSLHDCFTRQLKDGARPVDPSADVLVSPCDAIVGETGRVASGSVLQAKGFPYALSDLLGDHELVRGYAQGSYVTLRLTSGMYHRFHAPYDCRVEQVVYISGDTWNVNPIALERVARLFCKNERAVIRLQLAGCGARMILVPVAAILVASIRLHFLDVLLHLRYRGPNVIPCDAQLRKGEEMGWFEHGSTIIVFAPPDFRVHEDIRNGRRVRMGQALFHLPADA
ncbi:MAG TPA: archaetidylserine decarboxylase [Steroidobacteraceae bacterium]|nr:archaetidylserine decarboxylase [Steroidobacteraceae bacterium]